MTTKVLTGTYSAGYNAYSYSTLELTSTARVGGAGVSGFATTILNYGTINATASAAAGVTLYDGGSIQNGAFFAPGGISGQRYGIVTNNEDGVVTNALVVNYGYIGGGKTGIFITGYTPGDAGAIIKNHANISGQYAGVDVGEVSTIINYGNITANISYGDGIIVRSGGAGGYVRNAGYISAFVGVRDASLLINTGTINGRQWGVLANSGTVINGSLSDATALIEGAYGVILVSGGASLSNFGTVQGGNAHGGAGHNEYGARVTGTLVNGAATDITARIQGFSGAEVGGVLNNYGVIDGTGVGGDGVVLYSGQLTNGSSADRAALIVGYGGVVTQSTTSTIANFGTVESNGGASGYGVSLDGGRLVNGAATIVTARIQGGNGVSSRNGATILNYGSIVGTVGSGLDSVGGGVVVNGSNKDRRASIRGVSHGVASFGASTKVTNYGSIKASATGSSGVYEYASGGTITNGSTKDKTALISGATGVVFERSGTLVNTGRVTGVAGAGVLTYGGLIQNATPSAVIQGTTFGIQARGVQTVTNFGSVLATGGAGAFGLAMNAGGVVTNGSSTATGALIQGYSGVFLSASASATNFGLMAGTGAGGGAAGVLTASSGGGATLTNFGSIAGAGGVAVRFNSSSDVLVVEAGSAFTGAIIGAGGTIDLGSGVGSLSLLAGGGVVVSGSMAATTFFNFGAIGIGAGATFTLAGTPILASGQTLTINGIVIDAGGLTIAGAVSGAGSLDLTGGTDTLTAGAALTIANLALSGASGVLNITAPTLLIAGGVTQAAGTVNVGSGDLVSFTGTGDSFAGTLAGAGTVAFTAGSDTLAGASVSAAHVTLAGAAVTVSGAIGLTSAATLSSGSLIVAAAGAGLTGGGTLHMAGGALLGATTAATLTNADTIDGAGGLGSGSMTLVNAAGGVIDANGASVLTVDTGAAAVRNAGLIEATGAGGAIIAGAVVNTGTLAAMGGNLTMDGAVTGAGSATISNAVLDFASDFTGNVAFTSGFGMLELARSQAYTGSITGFSLTGGTSLDLRDIGFLSPGEAAFSGTATSGTLTVSDGVHTARITLVGNFLGSTFTTSSDGHGGVFVVDPPNGPVKAPSPNSFATVMAGLGGGVGGAIQSGAVSTPRETLILVPRAGVA